ncbi:TPA: hypothetical protein DIC39_00585 [Patescibacteria group bacterium]|nr:MAG: hypothetical protein UX54_C0006G0009 [Parcubacteria group bacterium GW2011_GWA2_46_39]HBV33472.1 hypothetical protein [Patescibacteria group bacterium]HCU47550.1 hypothetical protein [Patescibacteria group bacterium]
MLAESRDILNITLAISIFGLAFILGWILIYFLIIIRQLVKLVESIENKVKKVDDFVTLARQKIDGLAAYLPVLAMGVKELVSLFANKKNSRRSRKK